MPGATHYLDHAATTPMVPAAVEAMTRHLREVGNPSSLHASGRNARRVVEESRETIAQALNCRPGEVVFTSGGTEADNLALKGIHWARRAEDPRRTRILTTAVEHHAVLDPLDWLARRRGRRGRAAARRRHRPARRRRPRAAIERDPASVSLVSVMWANNEVGTLQPIEDVVAIAAEHGIPVHTDAVQAVGAVPVDFAASRRRRADPDRPQARRPVRRRRADRAPRGRGDRAGPRRRPGARHPQRHHRHPGDRRLRGRRRAGGQGPGRARRPGRRAPRRPGPPRHRGRPGRAPARRHDGAGRRPPAARQRPPRLPRLRGRLAADAARRPRHRVLDRLGLLGRRAAALARAARDGLRRRTRPGTRCGSRSATPRPQADVDAVVEAIGPVVERAGRPTGRSE